MEKHHVPGLIFPTAFGKKRDYEKDSAPLIDRIPPFVITQYPFFITIFNNQDGLYLRGTAIQEKYSRLDQLPNRPLIR
jgi:hypothetical protein